MVREHEEPEGLGSAPALVQIVILPPASWVVLSMSLCLAVPQSPHVSMGSTGSWCSFGGSPPHQHGPAVWMHTLSHPGET